MTQKYVFSFHEGNKDMRSLLGGKGANLAEMTNLGLNVPPGFTVTTEACNRFYDENEQLWDELLDEISVHVSEVEEKLQKKFSDTANPLLFSVRSGAVFSMPGMMDTILNLGLNDQSVVGLANSSGNERFAYDSYRRFIEMFGDVAMEISKEKFDSRLEKMKEDKGVDNDTDLDAEDLKKLVIQFKEVYRDAIGSDFPQNPLEQLRLAIIAVFRSWMNPRAQLYRKLNDIDDNLGTAVNVQSMVFGNMGNTSGTGVAFSRNPANGENKLFGEFLLNAQGEDVVAGIRTPVEISHLKESMPEVYDEFLNTTKVLEEHYKDMQDIEFTIENEKLFILQTRNGKRTAHAAVNVAVDLVDEGLISKEEAVMRIEPESLDQLLHPTFDEKSASKAELLVKGLAASPGAAYGAIYFTAADVKKARESGVENIILVRQETSPEDLEGMVLAQGILTARGGMTSHAAVVARGMGKCCVAGAEALRIDERAKTVVKGDIVLKEGDVISVDGSTGKVYIGQIPTTAPELSGNFGKIMEWADNKRRLRVRSNADTPRDAKQALEFGAQGIGLCRTEHMFFDEDRIMVVREMILAKSKEDRIKALEKLEPIQEQDFYEIYSVMGELPVTVRLLDPPLHEFLPTEEKDIQRLSEDLNVTPEELRATVLQLKEINPMLGHRGIRLAVTYPEIYRMQVRAIIQAALRVKSDTGRAIKPEIMLPLVCEPEELKYVKKELIEEIEAVMAEKKDTIEYEIGTMIEIPRAAILADEIAAEAEFFSFGTNDMTQMTFGFSRDDAGKFLAEYEDKKIFKKDPFVALDQKGVGALVKLASKLGKEANPDLHLGICGEHGGEPNTVKFCHDVGLDYVSCSPFRVPIARIAAAQAAIAESRN